MKHLASSPWGVMLLLGLVLGAWFGADRVLASDDDTKEAAALIKAAKVSMATAVTTAERHAKGKAVEAELERDDGKAVYEIHVLVDGAKPKLVEVEIDAATGKILVDDDKDDDDDDDDDDKDADDK